MAFYKGTKRYHQSAVWTTYLPTHEVITRHVRVATSNLSNGWHPYCRCTLAGGALSQ